ncbi:hypothetical protein AB0H82_07050 [Streptomyces sp. NPDC050732]|uniref:hypothetical protein n=1 Tax=Streptomyces sp. NPDC050732 TaxID=3154632 RepID=UPI0034389EE7
MYQEPRAQASEVTTRAAGNHRGGKLVEFAGHRLRLLMEQVRVGVHPPGAEDRTEDSDERVVRVRELSCLVHGGDAEGKIGRGRSAHEDADLGAGVLQTFDGGGQLLVDESPQITRVRVGTRAVTHLRDLGEGEPQSGEACAGWKSFTRRSNRSHCRAAT